MPTRASKKPTTQRPRDVNQLAKMIVDMTTGDLPKEDKPPEREKNPAAVALGKLGASKGGQARAAKLSAKKRKEIAKNAAQARWNARMCCWARGIIVFIKTFRVSIYPNPAFA